MHCARTAVQGDPPRRERAGLAVRRRPAHGSDPPILARRTSPVGVSDFVSAEFASAVARRVQIARTTAAQGVRLLSVYDGWVAANAEPIELEPADVRVASTFVRRFETGLRTPDALHVAIYHRLGLPLPTFDERQSVAAERLGVRRGPIGAAGR